MRARRCARVCRAQRGTTLLEALVSFLVLCLGMLTVARVQTQLHLGAALADQRSQAVRLAEQDLEALRDFTVRAAAPTRRAYEQIVSGAHPATGDTGSSAPTSFIVAHRIDPLDTAAAKSASVTVSWNDRAGQMQQVTLHSIIAAYDPAATGALAQGAAAPGATALHAPGVPPSAQDLGDGMSIYRSVGDAGLAYLIDNVSGRVRARCTGVKEAGPLARADLTHCDERAGLLVSGVVRFTSASPPDAGQANDPPPATTVTLASASDHDAAPVSCTAQAMSQTASEDSPAAPSGIERFVAYDCVVSPEGPGGWTGTTWVQSGSWPIGTHSGEQRVCRYVGDPRDAIPPHPGATGPDHVGLQRSLSHQNFLVIPATASCPTGNPVRLADASMPGRSEPVTVPHQP